MCTEVASIDVYHDSNHYCPIINGTFFECLERIAAPFLKRSGTAYDLALLRLN